MATSRKPTDTPPAGSAALQRPPAEIQYAAQIAQLQAQDKDPRPPGWAMSLKAARRSRASSACWSPWPRAAA
jgi:hypothetical protein